MRSQRPDHCTQQPRRRRAGRTGILPPARHRSDPDLAIGSGFAEVAVHPFVRKHSVRFMMQKHG